MVRRGDHDGLDAAALVQHLPVIAEPLGLGIGLERVGRQFPVDVAQGDDVLRGHLAQVAGALTADADAGNVQFRTGRRLARAAQDVTRNHGQTRRGSGKFQELSSFHACRPFLKNVE